jgi:DNA-binding MarR family transcriptional regulator
MPPDRGGRRCEQPVPGYYRPVADLPAWHAERPPRRCFQAGSGRVGSVTVHSASLMSDGWRGARAASMPGGPGILEAESKAYFDAIRNVTVRFCLMTKDTAGPVEITDPAAMRALAHPLKWDLMDVLLQEGTATSTRCAELLGQSQATCSFHLRQLARYGLVEEAPSESKRERPWRLTVTTQTWSMVQPDEARTRAVAELEHAFVQREMARLMRWQRTALSYPQDWREAALRAGAQTWLTAGELADLSGQIIELMTRYRDRLTDPALRPAGSRPVRIFAAGYPLPDEP